MFYGIQKYSSIGVTMLFTQTGVGKYKAIQKKEGNVLEWTTCFMDCGYTSVCTFKYYKNNTKSCLTSVVYQIL